MPIAITPEHESMSAAATAWAQKREVLRLTRRLLETEDVRPELDSLWQEAVEMGWTGLLVPELLGGSGHSLAEAVVLLEALGGSCAPLPVVGTLAASVVLAADGTPDSAALLRGIAEGTVRVGVPARDAEEGETLSGDLGPVEGGASVTHLAVIAGPDVVVVDRGTEGIATHARTGLDPSRSAAQVSAASVDLAAGLRLVGAADPLRTTVRLLVAADSAGLAQACLAMAVEYAKTRVAFGRTIGSFQAVKHHCATMLLDVEVATAATWRAASAADGPDAAVLADIAYRLATRTGLSCAKTTLQLHGGIGFTWEHDIHLFLRRAGQNAAYLGASDEVVTAVGRAEMELRRPGSALSLPPETEAFRAEVVEFRERVLAAPEEQRHQMVVDAGYLFPHWPAPWGLGADAVQQLVIEEETRQLDRTSALGETAWELPIILPTILAVGSAEQQERWMRPTMMGETHWCHLFSEPGAGSDLAALTTRAVRTDGGWVVTGQKVWTSDAHHADVGIALVRTDPAAPKHQGITCMVVDMRSEGVTIRPLRQITGGPEFNEVFLDGVFVPDENVIGEVNAGWTVARASLGIERVSLGTSTWNSGEAWAQIMELTTRAAGDRPDLVRKVGEIALVAEGAKALGQRSALRAVLGRPAGIEGSIAKLVVAEHARQVGDYALDVLAENAAFSDGESALPTRLFLQCRMATIAGGTSEVLRNLLAERALGLPREPESVRA